MFEAWVFIKSHYEIRDWKKREQNRFLFPIHLAIANSKCGESKHRILDLTNAWNPAIRSVFRPFLAPGEHKSGNIYKPVFTNEFTWIEADFSGE